MQEIFLNNRGIRSNTLIIGQQRCGKSRLTNELLKYYIDVLGGCGFVYGLGRQTDFEAARPAIIPSLPDIRENMSKESRKSFDERPQLFYYKDVKAGTLEKLNNFNIAEYKKAIKVPRMQDNASELLLMKLIYNHFAKTLIILDDARRMFRYGVKEEFLQIFSGVNHIGNTSTAKNWRTTGSDVITIFHSLDHVNNELLDYCTHIITFKYEFEPDFNRIDHPFLQQELSVVFENLQELPPFYFSVTDLENKTTVIYDDMGKPAYMLDYDNDPYIP